MDQLPALTYDVIVAILTATLGHLRRQRLTRGFPLPPGNSRSPQLADLLLVMPDLDPLARIILPLLPHAWPVQRAATYGRLDALVHIHDRGLLGTRAAPNTARIQAILAAANAAEHLHVLRWLLEYWPVIVQADVGSAQRAIVDACNMSPPERGVEFMDFWVHEAGLLDESAVERRQAVLTDEAVYKAIGLAFREEHCLALGWWGKHSHISKQARVWDWEWVYSAIRAGQIHIVGVCADLEEDALIQLSTTASPSGRRLPSWFPVLAEDASLESQMVDLACMWSQYPIQGQLLVPMLRFWKQRQAGKGKPLVFTSRSIEQARNPDILDWWFKESQLPLTYSTNKALKFATSKGAIDILDWWLGAWKSALVAALDYDEWIMILATMRCVLDAECNVVSVAKSSSGYTTWTPDVADWWAASGLELKLPGPTSAVPSAIDVCAFEPALNWWLARAKRLKAQAAAAGHAEIPLVDFFPYYTTAGIYRAVYWGSTSVFRWWKNVHDKGILRPCSPSAPGPSAHEPYSHSRVVELAAMCADEWAYDFNLRSVLESSSPDVSFRGSLVEWARQRVLRPENPLPDYGPNTVLQVCGNLGIDPENGELPPPEGGYVRQGPSEEMVFNW